MIGFFDSGYGGLTVLEPFLKKLPNFRYFYLGDNARYPYGNRSKETILQFSRQIVNFLIQKGVKHIFCACNTVSSVALPELKKEFSEKVKIYGVIDPVARYAVKISKNNQIGVVGTRATIESGIYNQKIKSLNEKIKVYSQPCPLIVPLIEESWHKKREAKMILKSYLRPLKNANVDTLILGCTHYPFMVREFQKIMGKKVEILTNGEILVDFFQKILSQNPQILEEYSLHQKDKEPSVEIFTTDCANKFLYFAQKNLQIPIPKPQKIQII